MRLTRARTLLLCLSLLLGLAAIVLKPLKTAVEAYLYAYPLVAMDVTRERSVTYIAPKNVLYRQRRPADAQYTDVIRPSADLLYSMAFLDMKDGPFVLSMPAHVGRYTLVPLLDAWSNVFASVGTRLTGDAAVTYLVVGPGFAGPVPDGLKVLAAPTRLVWMMARTQLINLDDLHKANLAQNGIRLESLAQWQARHDAGDGVADEPVIDPAIKPGFKESPSPAKVLDAMPTPEFFARFTALWVDNPPALADAPMVEKLAGFGLKAGQPPQWNAWQRGLAELGRTVADTGIELSQRWRRDTVNGWWTPPMTLGAFGTDYPLRAGVAKVALAANLAADAVYPTAVVDGQGKPLHGDHVYRLHFAAAQLPPVKAFWSVTAYGADAFLMDNPVNRYSVRSGDALQFNADGSLDLLIAAEHPSGVPQANWLPVRKGEPFQLTARLYWPQEAILQGRWTMPPVERVVERLPAP